MSAEVSVAVLLYDLYCLLKAVRGQRALLADAAARAKGADAAIEMKDGQILPLKKDAQGQYVPQVASGLKRVSVPENLKQEYAVIKTKQEVQAAGYNVVEEERLPDQSIRIVVRRFR